VNRERISCFVGYKEFQDGPLFMGIFNCGEAERWIILKKVLKILEKFFK
jgi:hypothetical protein